eukprot:c19123_g1_i1 orf=951-1574(+)
MHTSKDTKINALLKAFKLLPFTPSIHNAGKLYVESKIRKPFFCAQVRLLDGQFKKHWDKTFSALKAHLERVESQKQNSSELLHIFLMTDLPYSNWTGTYLGELAANTSRHKLHFLDDKEEIVIDTARNFLRREYGLRSGFLPQRLEVSVESTVQHSSVLPDLLLYVEQVVCSCASLGFIGTSGSTIAENIAQLRNVSTCTNARISLQ